jgi:GxxExxY protein
VDDTPGLRRRDLSQEINDLSEIIIGAAIETQKELGVGLLEKPYRVVLSEKLRARGLSVREEVPIPLRAGDRTIACAFRLDILVEERIIIEIKSVRGFDPTAVAQTLTYLRLTRCPLGLLLNFRSLPLGVRRIVLSPPQSGTTESI